VEPRPTFSENAQFPVAEQGTVTSAANVLRLTQPAVSRQIDDLERKLGFELFERVGRRLQLTARGEKILDDCRTLLMDVDVLRERAQALRQGNIAVLKVAATAWMIESAFPAFLHEYAKHQPEVTLDVIEANPADPIGLLESAEAHLAVTILDSTEPFNDRLSCHWLPHVHVVAAGAPSTGATADAIDIRDLAKSPLLLPKPEFATRRVFDAACHLAGVPQRIFFESGTSHTLLALAEAGHGMAIVPSTVQKNGQKNGKTLETMIVTHTQVPLRIAPAILWDNRRTPAGYAEAFADFSPRTS
jgi:DNA-binding transcriptional LysR family regulator